jgi:hypothetical protein
VVIDKYSVYVSQTPGKTAGYRYIADSTTGDQGAGNDDIPNFLRALIFPTLYQIHEFLNVLIYCRYIVSISV